MKLLWQKRFHYYLTQKTNVKEPFTVKWQVVNTGAEANHNLRGSFYDSDTGDKLQRTEATQYRGFHWVECFIIKDGVCVARSGEFVIKNYLKLN